MAQVSRDSQEWTEAFLFPIEVYIQPVVDMVWKGGRMAKYVTIKAILCDQ